MTGRDTIRLVLMLLAALVLLASGADAQSSSCADCHYATVPDLARYHVADWERSAHSRNKVGCESCHGGNASSYEAFLAHRGILPSSNPASMVHRRNLPATCGSCHTGPFVRFQKSHHFELLKAGDQRVPTCTTCHDAAGWRFPSPKVLESECQRCHGPKGAAPRIERAAAARTLLEEVRTSRDLLAAARPFIDRMKSSTRQAQLRQSYQQAEVPLIEAGRSVHEFVFDNLKERLATARQRIEKILAELANP
jgi:nitrate/TMAO reductase-like tetraheme cytochrome c subunit